MITLFNYQNVLPTEQKRTDVISQQSHNVGEFQSLLEVHKLMELQNPLPQKHEAVYHSEDRARQMRTPL